MRSNKFRNKNHLNWAVGGVGVFVCLIGWFGFWDFFFVCLLWWGFVTAVVVEFFVVFGFCVLVYCFVLFFLSAGFQSSINYLYYKKRKKIRNVFYYRLFFLNKCFMSNFLLKQYSVKEESNWKDVNKKKSNYANSKVSRWDPSFVCGQFKI